MNPKKGGASDYTPTKKEQNVRNDVNFDDYFSHNFGYDNRYWSLWYNLQKQPLRLRLRKLLEPTHNLHILSGLKILMTAQTSIPPSFRVYTNKNVEVFYGKAILYPDGQQLQGRRQYGNNRLQVSSPLITS